MSRNADLMSCANRARDLTVFLECEGRCSRRGQLEQRFGRRALDSALANGLVVPLLPGVFAHAARTEEFATRVAAARAWLPRKAAVSGLAALALHGLTDEVPALITVIVPKNLHLRAPAWMRVVRTDSITCVQMRRGTRCATPDRAIIDAWCEAPPNQRISIVLEAMRRSNVTGAGVLHTLAMASRVAGRSALVEILTEAMGGIESYLEHRAKHTVLNTADFRDLRRQVEVVAMGTTYTLDTYHEPTRTVIEFDGARVHGGVEAKKRDNRRDAALLTLGMVTLRIGYDDVVNRPTWCREVIRRTIAARAGGTPPHLNAL